MKDVLKTYHAGWEQKDPKRIEEYHSLINDLAEDIFIKERCTKALLIETLGYVMAEKERLIECFNELHGDVLLLAAKSLLPIGPRMDALRERDRKEQDGE